MYAHLGVFPYGCTVLGVLSLVPFHACVLSRVLRAHSKLCVFAHVLPRVLSQTCAQESIQRSGRGPLNIWANPSSNNCICQFQAVKQGARSLTEQ